MNTQEQIDNEMNMLAKSIASSQEWTLPELVKALGREGVQKAIENMNEEQIVSFKEELKKHISGVPDSKFDSCVEDVTPKQGEQSAYAICTESLKKDGKLEDGHTGKENCEKCMGMSKSDSTPDGLGEAMLGISEAPKESEKTEQKKKEEKDMEEVKKSENIVDGALISTDRGGKFIMNNDPEDRQAALDEMIAMNAMASEELRTHSNQGGPEKDGAWEGQIIGEEPKTVSENQPEPQSENKDSNIADNIVEINALGKLSKPERDAMKEKIIAFIESMMERQIEKSVGLDMLAAKINVPSEKLHSIYNAIELKKAEGSKGGHVVGHTKSGKPIYGKAEHKGHSSFHHEDHFDAMQAHHKQALMHNKVGLPKQAKTHLEEARKHEDSWRKTTPGMKKSDSMYYDYDTADIEYYLAKATHNPFSHRHQGHNCHFSVDSYIAEEEAAIQANLAKSTFFSPEVKHDTTRPSVQNLIAQGLDMNDGQFNTAIINKSSKSEPKGVVFVKSFEDDTMDSLFADTDTWGNLKKSEESKEESEEEKAKKKLMEMEAKEHGTEDPEKIVEEEKKEHADKE